MSERVRRQRDVRASGSRCARLLAVVASIGVVAALVVGALWWQTHTRPALLGERLTEFPVIDRSALTPTQVELVAAAEREFADPGAGTKYSQGVEESWCADFVSWLMRAAGAPLSNPNSGSWRIPGVATLQEYYEAQGRFVPAGQDYRPRTGDVLLYDSSSAFGQHTNMVLVEDAGVLTVIGGNEADEIRVERFALTDVAGFVGFGRL
ncbi:CHAP domain-containing protein [Nocardia callitridis]|uniref:Peptidase C51 domain-containing protein n=1 Tax=Nocardia callitridis TaxID=648753 RepID=A0ABP9JRF9_9NOCA